MSSFSEQALLEKLSRLTSSQDSIETLSSWIIHHRAHAAISVTKWLQNVHQGNGERQLLLLYLANDVLQNSRRKSVTVFHDLFKEPLKHAASLSSMHNNQKAFLRIIAIWRERHIYDNLYLNDLQSHIEPVVEEKPKAETPEPTSTEFKIAILEDCLTELQKFEGEMKVKSNGLSRLSIDVSSTSSLSKLKDKSSGDKFETDFEDASRKLQDYCECIGIEVNERKNLVDMLKQCKNYHTAKTKELNELLKDYGNIQSHFEKVRDQLKDRVEQLEKASCTATSDPSSKQDIVEAGDMEIDSDDEQQENQQPHPLPPMAPPLQGASPVVPPPSFPSLPRYPPPYPPMAAPPPNHQPLLSPASHILPVAPPPYPPVPYSPSMPKLFSPRFPPVNAPPTFSPVNAPPTFPPANAPPTFPPPNLPPRLFLPQADNPVRRDDPVVRRDEPFVRGSDPVVRREEPFIGGNDPVRRDEPFVRGSDPVVRRDEPFIGGNDHVIRRDEPFIRGSDPIVRRDEPFIRGSNPIVRRDEPFIRGRDEFIGGSDPINRRDEPFIGGSDPIIRRDESIIRRDEPFIRGSDPINRRDKPFIGGSDPIIRRDEPFIKGSDPVIRRDEPFIGGSDPIIRRDEPFSDPVIRRDEPFIGGNDLDSKDKECNKDQHSATSLLTPPINSTPPVFPTSQDQPVPPKPHPQEEVSATNTEAEPKEDQKALPLSLFQDYSDSDSDNEVEKPYSPSSGSALPLVKATDDDDKESLPTPNLSPSTPDYGNEVSDDKVASSVPNSVQSLQSSALPIPNSATPTNYTTPATPTNYTEPTAPTAMSVNHDQYTSVSSTNDLSHSTSISEAVMNLSSSISSINQQHQPSSSSSPAPNAVKPENIKITPMLTNLLDKLFPQLSQSLQSDRKRRQGPSVEDPSSKTKVPRFESRTDSKLSPPVEPEASVDAATDAQLYSYEQEIMNLTKNDNRPPTVSPGPAHCPDMRSSVSSYNFPRSRFNHPRPPVFQPSSGRDFQMRPRIFPPRHGGPSPHQPQGGLLHPPGGGPPRYYHNQSPPAPLRPHYY